MSNGGRGTIEINEGLCHTRLYARMKLAGSVSKNTWGGLQLVWGGSQDVDSSKIDEIDS